MPKLSFIKIKTCYQKIKIFLTNHPFILINCLLVILIGYAAFIAYYYVYNPPLITSKSSDQIKIEENSYQKIIEQLDKKATFLANPTQQDYPDIFR